MNHNLRDSIVESIKAKRLTEQELSVAPMISFEYVFSTNIIWDVYFLHFLTSFHLKLCVCRFWKNSCFAFAMQCIDKGSILQAVPYLLSIHRVSDAIERLCQNSLHREAWCIAKMSKESEDPIFEKILTDWIQYLEETGNLEGAALM